MLRSPRSVGFAAAVLLSARFAAAQPAPVVQPAPAPPAPVVQPAPEPTPAGPPAAASPPTLTPAPPPLPPPPPGDPSAAPPTGEQPAPGSLPPAAPVFEPVPPPPPAMEPPPPPPKQSEGVYEHDGFYLRMGLGAGYMMFDYERDDREGKIPVKGSADGVAGVYNFTIGGNVGPGVVLAGTLWNNIVEKPSVSEPEIDGQRFSSDQLGQTQFGGLGVLVDWYPDPKQGLHFLASLNLAFINATKDSEDKHAVTDPDDPESQVYVPAAPKHETGGFAIEAGGGYDFWVGEEWSIGPLLKVTYGGTQSDPQEWQHTAWVVPSLLFSATYH